MFILSLSSFFVVAQNPSLPPGIPGLRPASEDEEESGTATPKNLTQGLGKPDPNALYPGELSLLNIDGNGMAALYQSVTGKRVLVSSAAKDAQFSFVQAGGLTNGQLATLIEKFLLMEGFQLNPDLGNPDIVSFLAVNQSGGGANVVEPVKVIDDPAQLALETGVVAYVMTFQYLKPEEAQRAFTQIYGQLRPGGTIAEVRNASALIITEKADLIESLIKLKDKIDVPTAQIATDFVEVKYADVQELADQLNEMFNAQQSSNQSARVQRQANTNTPPIPGLANSNAGGGGGTSGEETPPTITPDSRTNRIFLMGRPVDLIFIKKLIAEWDVESSQRNFLRRKLKYLPVYEFIPVAETAISSTLGDSSATGGAARGSRSTANANNRQTGATSSNRGATSSNSSRSNSSIGGASGGSASLSGGDGPTQPESILIGKTLLVSDNVANSIIVQGPPHHIEIVEKLIDELDVKHEQVAITDVFGRYDVGNGLSFGVDMAQLLNSNGIGFTSGNSTRAGGNIIDRESINAFADLTTRASGLSLQGFAGDFGVFVNALESYTDLRTFARPTIFTTNNKEARISSGRQIAIPTSTFQSGTNGSLSSNVEYRDVALELLVRPLVNSKEEITLEISIIRDAVSDTSSVEQTDLDIPDLFSDELETTVTVPNGSAIILGGLIEDSENNSDSGVPILKNIPLLGNLFETNSEGALRSELVIMIRPIIVDGRVAFNQFQNLYDYGSNLSGDSRKEFVAPAYGAEGGTPPNPVITPSSGKGGGFSSRGRASKSFSGRHKR